MAILLENEVRQRLADFPTVTQGIAWGSVKCGAHVDLDLHLDDVWGYPKEKKGDAVKHQNIQLQFQKQMSEVTFPIISVTYFNL